MYDEMQQVLIDRLSVDLYRDSVVDKKYFLDHLQIPTYEEIKQRIKRKMKTDYLLQFFKYEHLPAHLQVISKPFCDLANRIVEELPSNPERSTAIRRLLESKDCAVRAALFKED